MGVCTPLSATQYEEYVYGYNVKGSNCLTSTCGVKFS
jgi:hypothetical protein